MGCAQKPTVNVRCLSPSLSTLIVCVGNRISRRSPGWLGNQSHSSIQPMSSKDLPVLLFPGCTGVTDVFHIAWLLYGYWNPNADTLSAEPSPQPHTSFFTVLTHRQLGTALTPPVSLQGACSCPSIFSANEDKSDTRLYLIHTLVCLRAWFFILRVQYTLFGSACHFLFIPLNQVTLERLALCQLHDECPACHSPHGFHL